GEELVLAPVRVAGPRLALAQRFVEARLLHGHGGLRGETLHDALVHGGEAARFLVPEEKSAEHLALAADDGDREIADHGQVTPGLRVPLSVTGILADIVRTDHGLAAEGGAE